jgi:hypothetical protein
MTRTQVEYLKMLGYENTQEDGAILQHKFIGGCDGFVWKDAKFKDVMSTFASKYKKGFLRQFVAALANEI